MGEKSTLWWPGGNQPGRGHFGNGKVEKETVTGNVLCGDESKNQGGYIQAARNWG